MTWIGKSHTTQVLVVGREMSNELNYEPKCSLNPMINRYNIIIFQDKRIKYILLININHSYCLIISNYLNTIIYFNLDKYYRYLVNANSIQQKLISYLIKRYE